jgi:O-antigen/teichoic acid export membrane protein
LIASGLNLIAILSAQIAMIIIRRIWSYRAIYTVDIERDLQNAPAQSQNDILKAIYPNAVKIGLPDMGGFLVNRSALIVGSLHLPLESIASYGITVQIIVPISNISRVYLATYQPKIVQYRVQDNIPAVKRLYIKGSLFSVFTHILGGLCFLFLGKWALNLIVSQTPLLNQYYIMVALLIALLETNHGNAANLLVTKNEVPFFKASLFSGALTLGLLFVFLRYTGMGVLGLILAPGIAQGCYQNWKWPLVVSKELNTKILKGELNDEKK